MMSESKKAPPLILNFSEGVEVPSPRKLVEARNVTFDPASVNGEQISLN